jgi:Queuosine biosynthesis protein QueC
MTEIPSVVDATQEILLRPFFLYLKAPQEKRRPSTKADGVVHLDGPSASGLAIHHNFRQLWPLPDDQSGPVQAFLLLALGVWAADKLTPRSLQPDAWTRELRVEVPATPAWAGLAPEVARLLNFLTGDLWTITPRETRLDLGLAAAWPHAWQPTAVSLFSGGLDSLTGAIALLEEGHRLILVSHYDYGQLAATQQSLAAALTRHYGPDRLHHQAVRVQFEGPELTLRSRSLLYLALGLTAAAAFPGPCRFSSPKTAGSALIKTL